MIICALKLRIILLLKSDDSHDIGLQHEGRKRRGRGRVYAKSPA